MSRFPGWTTAAIEKLGKISRQNDLSKPTKIIPKNIRDYVGEICSVLTMLNIEHKREYKFLHDRRFRFDIAIPEHKIAVEFEGGIYSGGAHTRGKHYSSDVKKYNLAVRHGWRLLRYTTETTKRQNWEFECADEIKKLIDLS